MKTISAAFVKAQAAFAPALKNATNPHFRNKYADLAACIDAVIDALNANGIALIQQAHEAENGVAIETVFLHESGERISGGVLRIPCAKQDPQGYGSAITYARRYSLMAACGIAPEDDDAEGALKRPVASATFEQRKAKPLEELSLLIAECDSLAGLQVLYAGLTKDEQTIARDMFTVKKKALT
jgi:hypothetical protein